MNTVPVNRLRNAHALLDQQLAVALGAKAPDPAEIQILKKRKLALKDRIAAAQGRAPTAH